MKLKNEINIIITKYTIPKPEKKRVVKNKDNRLKEGNK